MFETPSSSPPTSPDGAALPVVVACTRDLAERLTAHVEAAVGWQVVDPEIARWIRPALVLADGTVPVAVDAPRVLLLGDDVDAVEAVRRTIALAPGAVVHWPGERDDLAAVGAQVVADASWGAGVGAAVPAGLGAVGAGRSWRGRTGASGRPGMPGLAGTEIDHLAVAGAAGGVGATTIALALGGLASWQGRDVLVVARGDVPVSDVPNVAGDALGAPGVWGAARIVPAAPRLRVVRRVDREPGLAATPTSAPAGALLVEEIGVDPANATVLVLRRDRAGAEAVARTPAAALVLLDEGPLPEDEVLRGATGGTVVVLPRSARVARAGARCKVPGALPGSWLEPLRSLVPGFPTGR